MEYPPLTDYVQPDGLSLMYALMDYRERVAELRRAWFLDNLYAEYGRMTREEALLWKIPF